MRALSVSLLIFFAASTCAAQTPVLQWARQFGTTGSDIGRDIAATADGVYVGGSTNGTFPNLQNAGIADGFIRKYDAQGNVLWTRQFGTAAVDELFALAADSSGVYVAGGTGAAFPGQTWLGGGDAFVRKYDAAGNLLWTRQFGTPGDDEIRSVAVDTTGIYVTGGVFGALPGQVYGGNNREDAFVRKYDLNGNELWTHQFGTATDEAGYNISTGSGGVYVSGPTLGNIAANPQGVDAFLRKYDPNGNVQWTRQISSLGSAYDFPWGIGADPSGVYVCGETEGTFPDQAKGGSSDAWVRKFDLNGSQLWTRQFGVASFDSCNGVSTAFNWVYVPVASGNDSSIWRLNQDGSIGGTLEFTTSDDEFLVSGATDSTGAYFVGQKSGNSLGQTPSGGIDTFVVKVEHPPLPPTITSIGNAFGEAPLISPNTWVAIKGVNLAANTRIWEGSDFAGGLMPVVLDGTRVTVNGKPAYIYFISPTQINILVPPDALPGQVEVQVTTNGVATNTFTVAGAPRSLSFFEFVSVEGRRYVYGRHGVGDTIIGPTTLYPGLTTPARSGEAIYIAATGFGDTNMPVVSGAVTQSGVLPVLPVIKVNGVEVVVQFAGLVGVGTFQINFILPPNLPNGDVLITAAYEGQEIQPDLYITIQN